MQLRRSSGKASAQQGCRLKETGNTTSVTPPASLPVNSNEIHASSTALISPLPSETATNVAAMTSIHQYAPPLTPVSPNHQYYQSTNSSYYRTAIRYHQERPSSYESGYESTHSMYSEPEHTNRLLGVYPEATNEAVRTFSTGLTNLPSLLSPQQSPVNTPDPTYLQLTNQKSGIMCADSSGDEDDLLDAIAEWQQSRDK